ncbi:hypothetical protein GWG65_30830 [Bradyrhizobium sp. CSA207]|uniref:hypothetical protein n=1 Tax=Bradyrhizobium sp. CSA207 TaxID=2698826 RepID=UPI0023B09A14|nr:hypothetical protein [Bradyrhizobium sp. CSA207]MDE5445728.1 hypothetical protein [Bradyrhizobium sp. CSA207]
MVRTLGGLNLEGCAGVLMSTLAITGLFTVDIDAQAQSATPRFTLQGPGESSGGKIIRDALNRPCLDTEAASRPHTINPDVVDHVVSIKNNCPRTIKVKVCYYGSDKCNGFVVNGYKRVDTILGSMTKITAFRYSITQQ